MLGPVIPTPLLDRMSIQLQFTLGNTANNLYLLCSNLNLPWETLLITCIYCVATSRVVMNIGVSVRVMVFNSTFNNISVILWRSVFFMEETGVYVENNRPTASYCQTLSHKVSSTPHHE
jgi:hypothetical protein